MKKNVFLLLFWCGVGSHLSAQQLPNLPELKPNRFNSKGQREGKWVIWRNDKYSPNLSTTRALYEKSNTTVADSAKYYGYLTFKRGKPVDTFRMFYRTGEKYFVGKLWRFEADTLDGNCVFYHKTGEIKYKGLYVNGKREGKHLKYFRSTFKSAQPQLTEDYDYVQGELKMKKSFFMLDGSPLSMMPFEGDGILYEDDAIWKGRTKNCKMEHTWIRYYYDGSVKDSVTCENDRIILSLIERQYHEIRTHNFLPDDTLVNFAVRYFGKQHYRYIDALTETASVRVWKKQDYLWTALTVAESVFGKGHQESVNSLNNWITAVRVSGGLYTIDMYEKLMEAKKAWDAKTKTQKGAYSQMVRHLFEICNQLEKYEEAEHYLRKYTELERNNSVLITQLLRNQAQFYEQVEKYQDALKVHKEVVALEEPNTPEAMFSQSDIRSLYSKLGMHDSALAMAYQLFRGNKNSSDSLSTFLTIAYHYAFAERYDSCQIVIKKALQFAHVNKLDTISVPNYGSYSNLVSSGADHGSYSDLVLLSAILNLDMKKVITINEKQFQHAPFETLRNILAEGLSDLYSLMGDYNKHSEYFKIYKKHIINNYGIVHSKYFDVLSEEAKYNGINGDYKKALDTLQYLYQKAILKKSVKNRISQNLSEVYKILGQEDAAFQVDTARFAVEKEMYGERSFRRAVPLQTLGVYAMNKGDYAIAKGYLLQSQNIIKQVHEQDNYALIKPFSILSQICEKMHDFTNALHYSDSTLLLIKRSMGENSFSYAPHLVNQSQIYRKMKHYSKAIELNEQARSVFKKQRPDTLKFDYQRNNANYFYLQLLIGAPSHTFTPMTEYYLNFLKHIDKSFNALDKNGEKSKVQLLQARLDVFNTYKTVAYQLALRSETSQNGFLYDMALLQKEIVLNDARIYRLMETASDSATFQTFLNWKRLNYQVLNPPFSFDSESERAEWRNDSIVCTQLFETLLKRSKIFKQTRAIVHWKDVQARLKDGEVAIEYDMLPLADSEKTLYYALIIQKNALSPVFLPLFDEKELKTLLDESKLNDTRDAVISRYNNSGYGGGELYQLIWSKIDSVLKRSPKPVHTIFLATTGLLENIAFDILPTRRYSFQKDTLLLSDVYKIHRVRSTRELVISDVFQRIKDKPNVLLYGSINYNADSTVASVATGDKGGYFHAKTVEPVELYTSMVDETQQVQQTCNANQATITIKQGNDATEGHFKNLNGKSFFDIIHFNTHGVYVENGLTDPLYRSYLTMAGCNKYLRNPTLKRAEDGLLTAHEIALVDLTQTQLVVLSACQTALGDIQGSEGVYGLRRALRLAGTDFILVSLWKVPSEATTTFMTLFYQNLLTKMPIRAAFEQTQKTMRRNYPNPNDKHYWAAWVLIQ